MFRAETITGKYFNIFMFITYIYYSKNFPNSIYFYAFNFSKIEAQIWKYYEYSIILIFLL